MSRDYIPLVTMAFVLVMAWLGIAWCITGGNQWSVMMLVFGGLAAVSLWLWPEVKPARKPDPFLEVLGEIEKAMHKMGHETAGTEWGNLAIALAERICEMRKEKP